MTNPDPFNAYLGELRKNLATGAATELTHRSPLQALLHNLAPRLQVIHEPKRVECGAPDFIVTRGQTPVAYVEAKDVDESLDAAERSDQLKRYRASLNNLILTDYLEFRWYVEGERRDTARLASVDKAGKLKSTKAGIEATSDLLQRFFAQEVPTVGEPRDLARRMAALARMMRGLIEETFAREDKDGPLHAQLLAFRETLIPDLKPDQFADMYAQTITYGLFAARLRAPAGEEFTREKAAWNLPPTNPFLRKLFNEIAGPDLNPNVAWVVDDLAHLLDHADMSEILRDFGKRTKQEDPVVHFYETFLGAYDPKMKQTRGVFYTPEPVVSYIVRSIDHLLKTRFKRPLGLADENVLILDPACGTGTFLYFVIQQIYETVWAKMGRGAWNSYVAEKLLPTVFGFELLMAPYAVAHMKLAIQLQETGYQFHGDERVAVYLTNALAAPITKAETLGFARFISDEADAAAEVKREKPIMVVLGNPPYSVSSANKGVHIERLMDRYKEAVRKERNIQPLSDDYIKFIRFAHDRIERTAHGIVGMITNHSYLSGLIHRGMREELMKTFDEIYVLNLHGNALIGETALDGGPDENVFDIRQGVGIVLLVKQPNGGADCRVNYADLWGLRRDKYSGLLETDVATTHWRGLSAAAPHFFLVPKDFSVWEEYVTGMSAADIFMVKGKGMATRRDHLCVDFDRGPLLERFRLIASDRGEQSLRDRFGIVDTAYWRFAEARRQIRAAPVEAAVRPYSYRVLDLRYVYYNPRTIERGDSRWAVMKHLLQDNVSLVVPNNVMLPAFRHAWATRHLVDYHILETAHANSFVFPLYLYTTAGGAPDTLLPPEHHRREPNLSPALISAASDHLMLDFVSDGRGDLHSTFGPEDIFNYMYAVFHSPTYRERYAEFLKIDFPRLPLTSDPGLFRALAEKGEELVALHLMESPKLSDLITTFPVSGTNEVEKVRYAEPRDHTPGRVYINKTQCFEGIAPDVWEFYIGGYQVLHKWLKDRKGRLLSFDDLFHYQKIVVALKETMRLMQEIDEVIPAWPIE